MAAAVSATNSAAQIPSVRSSSGGFFKRKIVDFFANGILKHQRKITYTAIAMTTAAVVIAIFVNQIAIAVLGGLGLIFFLIVYWAYEKQVAKINEDLDKMNKRKRELVVELHGVEQQAKQIHEKLVAARQQREGAMKAKDEALNQLTEQKNGFLELQSKSEETLQQLEERNKEIAGLKEKGELLKQELEENRKLFAEVKKVCNTRLS